MWRMDPDGLQSAVALFCQAIDKDESFALPYSYSAFALLHLTYLGFANDPEGAVVEATDRTYEALALDDKDALAHAMLARILTHERRYDDAVREAKHAVRLNANYAFGHFTLGGICWWAIRPAEGLEAVDRAIRLSPTDPFFHGYLALRGALLGEMGQLDKAIETVKKACRTPHKDYRIWMVLARVAAEANRMDEAREAAANMLELRPDFTLTRFREHLHKNWHPALVETHERQLIKLGIAES